jgi:acylphosphatase
MPGPTDAPQRLSVVVRGDVQGVGFRYYVLHQVSGTRLAGWVRNRADSGLECVAEGPEPELRRLLEALRRGPAGARIEAVEADWEPARGDLHGFHIRG